MLKDNEDITWLSNQIKTMVHLTQPPLGPWAADIRFTEHTEVEERDNLPIVPATALLLIWKPHKTTLEKLYCS